MNSPVIQHSPATDLVAIALGLALLCVGTVAGIGGTGLLMWVLGL